MPENSNQSGRPKVRIKDRLLGAIKDGGIDVLANAVKNLTKEGLDATRIRSGVREVIKVLEESKDEAVGAVKGFYSETLGLTTGRVKGALVSPHLKVSKLGRILVTPEAGFCQPGDRILRQFEDRDGKRVIVLSNEGPPAGAPPAA